MYSSRLRIPLVLALFALSLVGYGCWIVADLSLFKASISVSLGLASCISLWAIGKEKSGLRISLVLFLFVCLLGFVVASLAKVKMTGVFGVEPYPDARYAGFLAILLTSAMVGIWRRSMIARWLSMALAVSGVVSAGLNVIPWISYRSNYTWTVLIHIAGALLVLANLWGSDMRALYEKNSSPTWTSQNQMIRALRWAIVSQMAAIPMLLVYTWMQPIVPATASSALVLAIFLSLSIFLAMRHMVIGALGLILGGVSLLALTTCTLLSAYAMSPEHGQIAAYYAIFWIPAGLLALVCGARLATPVVRLLAK